MKAYASMLLLITLSACQVVTPMQKAAPVSIRSITTPTKAQTSIPPTLTSTWSPTHLALPTGDAFFEKLSDQGYQVVDSAKIVPDKGPEVQLFILAGKTYSIDEDSPEHCRLLFYQIVQGKPRLFASLKAPATPKGGSWGEGGFYSDYPSHCRIVNWDSFKGFHAGVFYFWLESDTTYPSEIREAFDAHLYASDINHNGLPEFTVSGFYCSNACNGQEEAVHFYEIRKDGVVDLTGHLPGVVFPWEMSYSTDPPTLYVRDISLQYTLRELIYSYWLYEWNGNDFVDVSPKHAKDYQEREEPLITQMRAHFGSPFPPVIQIPDDYSGDVALLELLFNFQKAGLRDQAFSIYMDLSDPAHWPGTEPEIVCWLQLIRARAQEEYRKGLPFSLPWNIDLEQPLPFSLSRYLEHTPEYKKYDLSACQAAFP